MVKNQEHILVTGSLHVPVQMMDYCFFMRGFGCFLKDFAKMLMVLESNIKAIRHITDALTCLLIELRLNGQVNTISVMLGLLQETGRD